MTPMFEEDLNPCTISPQNNWVPRREDNAPKTIEQIHLEAHQEEAQKKANLINAPHDTKSRGRGMYY